jgi:hypothetical protein
MFRTALNGTARVTVEVKPDETARQVFDREAQHYGHRWTYLSAEEIA